MKVLDLFSGIGGFALGLDRAGMETAAFCDIDQAARNVLRHRFPNVPVFDDVTTLTKETLDHHGITIDAIVGGFPCQDISLVGKGGGLAGERSGLWFEFLRLIQEIKPKFIIAENVSALRSRGLDEVLRSLAEVGYDAEWHCIPASTVGAPHRRDRIWIIGYPNNIPGLETTQVLMPDGESWKAREDVGRRYWGSISRTRRPLPESIDMRVDDGLPNRVDRHKQLGNAVVPAIPEIIGKAILEVIK